MPRAVPGLLPLVAPEGRGSDLFGPSVDEAWGVMDALVLPAEP